MKPKRKVFIFKRFAYKYVNKMRKEKNATGWIIPIPIFIFTIWVTYCYV